jgi:hypothetical protein
MSENNFADGMFFYAPKDTQAHFLFGNISIRPDVFAEWLLKQPTKDKGFVSLQALRSKNTGKPYVILNTYNQTQQRASQQATEEATIDYPDEEIDVSQIPF